MTAAFSIMTILLISGTGLTPFLFSSMPPALCIVTVVANSSYILLSALLYAKERVFGIETYRIAAPLSIAAIVSSIVVATLLGLLKRCDTDFVPVFVRIGIGFALFCLLLVGGFFLVHACRSKKARRRLLSAGMFFVLSLHIWLTFLYSQRCGAYWIEELLINLRYLEE